MLLTCLIVVFFASVEGSPKVPNIVYISKGYNIFKGDPLNDVSDPGFTDQQIFNLTYNNKNDDGKWLQPDSVSVSQINSCVQGTYFSQITGEKSYQKLQENSVDLGAKGTNGEFSGAFTSGASFKDTSNSVYNKNQIVYTMSAKCFAYRADITKQSLTRDFIDEVNNLPATVDKDAYYYAFFDKFGTHYINSAEFGSSFIERIDISKEGYLDMLASKTNIKAGVEGSFMEMFSLSVSASSSTDTTSKTKVKKYITKSYVVTKGSKPPVDRKWETWAQSTGDSPYPSYLKLGRISSLLTSENFKGANPTVLQLKVKLMDSSLSTYCPVYLKSNNCRPAKDDLPLPLPKGCQTGLYTKSSGEKVCFGKLQPNLNWNDANKNCQWLGARLPVIRTQTDNAVIKTFTVKYNNNWDGLWLDITRQGHSNYYTFSSDQSSITDYSPWARNQPSWGDEECVGMLTDGTWNDYKCWNNRGYDGTPTMVTLCEFVVDL